MADSENKDYCFNDTIDIYTYKDNTIKNFINDKDLTTDVLKTYTGNIKNVVVYDPIETVLFDSTEFNEGKNKENRIEDISIIFDEYRGTFNIIPNIDIDIDIDKFNSGKGDITNYIIKYKYQNILEKKIDENDKNGTKKWPSPPSGYCYSNSIKKLLNIPLAYVGFLKKQNVYGYADITKSTYVKIDETEINGKTITYITPGALHGTSVQKLTLTEGMIFSINDNNYNKMSGTFGKFSSKIGNYFSRKGVSGLVGDTVKALPRAIFHAPGALGKVGSATRKALSIKKEKGNLKVKGGKQNSKTRKMKKNRSTRRNR